jgi:hypothetical protein
MNQVKDHTFEIDGIIADAVRLRERVNELHDEAVKIADRFAAVVGVRSHELNHKARGAVFSPGNELSSAGDHILDLLSYLADDHCIVNAVLPDEDDDEGEGAAR